MDYVGRSRETSILQDLAKAVQASQGRALVVRGEAGIGKSALIQRLIQSTPALQLARAGAVESEMELPFGGLHQLCVPLLDLVSHLPGPQRDALGTVFGSREGDPPDRLLIGLAVLGLFCEAAERKPLLCVVDDAQWLDRASAQALAFVGRRLLADPVGVVIGTREADPEFSGLPELVVEGLTAADATTLLRSLPGAPLDSQVRDRVVVEAHGNPLALLEWHQALTPAEAARGSGLPGGGQLRGRLRESFRRRLALLPAETQRLLLVAAAEPVGDAVLVWRAAAHLGVGTDAVVPAVDAGLLEIDTAVRFRHPLVRSAAYTSASLAERQRAHRALAEVTDADVDPDRRVWHRALGTSAPDEDIAEQLERSAGRARARGGVAAAAAFLERSAILSTDPTRRAERALFAAAAKVGTGEFSTALDLLAIAESGPLDETDRAQVDVVHAHLASATNRGKDASALHLKAAERLEFVDPALARASYLDALLAAIFAGRLASPEADLFAVAQAAAKLALPDTPTAEDRLLEGLTKNFTEGYRAAVPILRRALAALADEAPTNQEHRRMTLAYGTAHYLWDDALSETLGARCETLVREDGALSELAIALTPSIMTNVFEGHLDTAAVLIEEVRAIAAATHTSLYPHGVMFYLAVRGDEGEATALMRAAVSDAIRRGEGFVVSSADWATAVLNNGLGRYSEALAAATRASQDLWQPGFSKWAIVELIEAATRCGAQQAAQEASPRLTEMARVCGTDWALGIDSRSRALLVEDDHSEFFYREAIDRLERTRIRFELARAHLLYGEWLRRQNRRVDARHQLRSAHEMFNGMGASGFAERARRELRATGETVRKRRVDNPTELTDQEACIARLVTEGLTNMEIGAQLFISTRTVEWHLRKVFTKLGVGSRRELRTLLRSVAV
jgi:DNA-binding CsgD family transcriptional regulator